MFFSDTSIRKPGIFVLNGSSGNCIVVSGLSGSARNRIVVFVLIGSVRSSIVVSVLTPWYLYWEYWCISEYIWIYLNILVNKQLIIIIYISSVIHSEHNVDSYK